MENVQKQHSMILYASYIFSVIFEETLIDIISVLMLQNRSYGVLNTSVLESLGEYHL